MCPVRLPKPLGIYTDQFDYCSIHDNNELKENSNGDDKRDRTNGLQFGFRGAYIALPLV